jgi:RNA polymerase sigma factor (sigma-70 family)
MVKPTSSAVLQFIRGVAEDERLRNLPDPELLRRFPHDRAAFNTLLRRHGPIVLDVCRSVLGNETDAEDAFQATFLILARKAHSIRKTKSLASWLYGVAYRTALKARAKAVTRRRHEAGMSQWLPSQADDLSWREVRSVVHDELNALPERFRAPLVLCYLEGRTQEVAAAQLGVTRRTFRDRLNTACALLRARLVSRGLGPAALVTVAGWPAATVSASVPLTLVQSTFKAVTHVAAAQAAATVLIPGTVAAVTKGGVRAMFLSKPMKVTTLLLVLAALSGAAGLVYKTHAQSPADTPDDKNANARPVQEPPKNRETRQLDNQQTAKPRAPASLIKRIQPGDYLNLRVSNQLPNQPISGVYRVEASSKLPLGFAYGRVAVGDMTVEEAESEIRNHLRGIIPDVAVSVTQADPQSEASSADVKRRLESLENEVRHLRTAIDQLQRGQRDK